MAEPENTSNSLDPENILIAEFEYIAQTAFQAHEDRSRVSTFYIVAVGSFIAAVFTTLDNGSLNSNLVWAFMFLFVGLGFYGLLTLLQIASLRNAWYESALAMSQIKEYYFAHVADSTLETAFSWRRSTIPKKIKWNSVSFLSALQVTILSAIMFGTAVAYLCLLQGGEWLAPSASAGFIALCGQLALLVWMLRD